MLMPAGLGAEDGGRKAALSPTASASDFMHSGGALRSWNLRFGAGLLAKLQLHPPLEGCLQPGASLAGLLDFRPARDAAARSPAAPSCLQVRPSELLSSPNPLLPQPLS